MKAKLVHLSGGQAHSELALELPIVTLGREADNVIQLQDDGVSRHHAKIERQGADYLLTDLGSTNGTRINGARIAAPVVLRNGDMIGIGSASLSFRLEAEAPGRPVAGQVASQARSSAASSRPRPPRRRTASTRSSGGNGTKIAGIGIGLTLVVCLCLVCGGAGLYVVTRGTETPTPEASVLVFATPNPRNNPTAGPNATKETPVVNVTYLTKDQVYISNKGKFTIQLPVGAGVAETATGLNVTFQNGGLGLSIEYYTDRSDPTVVLDKVITGLKQRTGAKLSTVRDAVVNGARGKRVAAEYSEKDGKVISHTAFALQHDNGMTYLIQARDNAADMDKDQASFQRLIGSIAYR